MLRHNLKRGVVVFIALFISLTIITFSQAFGISTPYLENDTLRVNPGQNYEYVITIQNSDGKDYYVDMNYSSTGNIVSLKETKYYVQADTYNNTVHFDIKVPMNALKGEVYILEYSARPKINESAPVVLGVEIKRSVKILVTDENDTKTTTPTTSYIQEPVNKSDNDKKDGIKQIIGKYFLIIIAIVLLALIINRVWRLSKGVAHKLGKEHTTKYTISQAISLTEVRILLQKITDEEYDLPEIRNIFKKKLSELTNNEIVEEIPNISRREAIIALDHILK